MNRKQGKLYRKLKSSVGKKVEVELIAREVFYGTLDLFYMSSPIVLGVKLNNGFVYLNFTYVTRMRVAGNNHVFNNRAPNKP